MAREPGASACLGSTCKMQVLGYHLQTTKSEYVGDSDIHVDRGGKENMKQRLNNKIRN